MVKINKEDKGRFLTMVLDSFHKGLSLREIKERINDEFNVDYSKRSISYWVDFVTRDDRLSKYLNQNRLMAAWNDVPEHFPPTTEQMAETIYCAVALHDSLKHEVLLKNV